MIFHSRNFIIILFSGLSFSYGQRENEVDSLKLVFESLPAGIQKVETAESLFHSLIHDNKGKALYYANQELKISEEIDHPAGKGIAYKDLAFYYRLIGKKDSARINFKKSVEILQEIANIEKLWDATYQYAVFENLEGNYDKALQLAEKSESIAMVLKDGEKLVESIRRKATSSLDRGDFKTAMEQALLALRVVDTLHPKNPIKKAKILAYLARIDIVRGNYEVALEPLEKALDIFVREKDEHWQATTLMEIGNLNWYIEDYDAAMESYGQSLEVSKKMNRTAFISMNLTNIALLHQSLGNYDLALETYFEAQKIDKQVGSFNNVIIGLNNIGTTYASKSDYRNAIKYFNEAIKKSDSIGSIDIIRDAYYGRSRAYEKIGNFKKALADQRSYQFYKDSVFNTTKSRQIEELKTVYETEKKEQQIALQENQITLLEQETKINEQQKLLYGIGFTLSLLVLAFGYYGFRQKVKRNRLEKDKLDAELAFKKKELTSHALHLAKKNEVLESVKSKAKELKEKGSASGYQELIKTINFDQLDDKNWESFTQYFEQVHKDFASDVKTKYPDVTKNELRFMALIKMNMSSKEIATILNISPDGVKKARQRLRKKMGLSSNESLENSVLAI